MTCVSPRLSVCVFISGLLSAFFFIFILCLASLVGRTCGRHGNYTELISELWSVCHNGARALFVSDEVIDNNQSWADSYPLGSIYQQRHSFPLTLRSVISSCAMNNSAVEALQLKRRMKLDMVTMDNVSLCRHVIVMWHCLSGILQWIHYFDS